MMNLPVARGNVVQHLTVVDATSESIGDRDLPVIELTEDESEAGL
jgi:hypothetical protein